jgi:predicted phosphodiesterase
MLYAIISDVHANLEAVEACFKRIDEINPDRIICLGDLVDYCAQPNEVIDIIKSRCDVVVLGNHDESQFKYSLIDGYTEFARVSSKHTRTVVSAEHVEYFKTLPRFHSEHDLFFIHASPAVRDSYKYVLNEEAAAINFRSFKEKICFIGHSHKPIIFEESHEQAVIKKDYVLDAGKRYIINVGSVGQPRNGDPRLCFGVFDSAKFEFHHERISYDIKSASEKILAQGLPRHLAERLFEGI